MLLLAPIVDLDWKPVKSGFLKITSVNFPGTCTRFQSKQKSRSISDVFSYENLLKWGHCQGDSVLCYLKTKGRLI